MQKVMLMGTHTCNNFPHLKCLFSMVRYSLSLALLTASKEGRTENTENADSFFLVLIKAALVKSNLKHFVFFTKF